jgi:hypothetical protein
MADGARSLVDRLSDRGLFDRFGFLTFAVAGSAAILLTKALDLPAVPIAVGAALIMAAYAVVVYYAGTGRLRGDQAGDNCYYLGLVFTLISLSYAIFTFDPANTATTIIQGFGIALLTTVLGLILRVFFNQTRVDLVETEDTARIELADAAGRLKAELSASVVSMNDFSRQTRQSLEELRDGILASLAEAGAAANRTISEQGTEASSRSKRLSTATDKVVAGMEKHADALAGIEKSTSGMATILAALEAAAEATRSSMTGLVTHAAELGALGSGMQSTGRDLQMASTEMLQSVRSFDSTAAHLDQVILNRLEEVRAVPQEIVGKAGEDLENAVAAMRRSLEAFAEFQAELANNLASQAREGLEVVDRHNAALESELAKSRGYVAKVHNSLVDMTAELAAETEGRAR